MNEIVANRVLASLRVLCLVGGALGHTACFSDTDEPDETAWHGEVLDVRPADGESGTEKLLQLPLSGRLVQVTSNEAQESAAAADTLLILSEPGYAHSALRRAALERGTRAVRPLAGGWYVGRIRVRSLAQLDAIVARLSAAPEIARVMRDPFFEPSMIPDDPRFSDDGLWGLRAIRAPEAWEHPARENGLKACVLDSGVDADHPDLAPNLWVNPGESGTDSSGRDRRTNGVDDDGNGYADDVHGWDFFQRNGNIDAQEGDRLSVDHGTHVAGTIGARGGDGVGLVGVNHRTQLVILKSSLLLSEIIEAIDYGASIGCSALNMSFGLSDRIVYGRERKWLQSGYQSAFEDAIQRAIAAGVVMVAAAGNNGIEIEDWRNYPAAFELPGLVTVAATGRVDATTRVEELAPFSAYGRRYVDLAAPGLGVLSTLPNGGYGELSGTSMAAPHVTGAAIFLRAAALELTPSEVERILVDSVEPLPVLRYATRAGGRLDLAAAVALATGSGEPSGAKQSAGWPRALAGLTERVVGDRDVFLEPPPERLGVAEVDFVALQSAFDPDTARAKGEYREAYIEGNLSHRVVARSVEDRSYDEETTHDFEIAGYVALPWGVIRSHSGERIGAADKSRHFSHQNDWVRFELPFAHQPISSGEYASPLVFANTQLHPLIVQIDGTEPGAFDYRIRAFDAEDEALLAPPSGGGSRSVDLLQHMVIERGLHRIEGGDCAEAATLRVNHTWTRARFATRFTDTPVVLLQPQTTREPDPVVSRLRNVSTDHFEMRLQEAEVREREGDDHAYETVAYVAVAPCEEQSEESIISEIFERRFGRTPDVPGLAFWRENYAGDAFAFEAMILGGAQGADRAYVLATPESRLSARDFFLTYSFSAPDWVMTDGERVVVRGFERYFGRAPDIPGLDYWSGFYNGDAIWLEATLLRFAQNADRRYVVENTANAARAFLQRNGYPLPTWLRE